MWDLIPKLALFVNLSLGIRYNPDGSSTFSKHQQAPKANGGGWSEAFKLSHDAVAQMTTAEKVSFLTHT